jgi:hypothetical protein
VVEDDFSDLDDAVEGTWDAGAVADLAVLGPAGRSEARNSGSGRFAGSPVLVAVLGRDGEVMQR